MKIKPGLTVSKQVKTNVRTATDEIITRQPFFAPTLLKHDVVITDDVPTALVQGNGRIHLGSEFIKDLDAQEVLFLLAHECLHPMMGHPFRRGNRDPAKWNWAGDAFINETLIEAGVGKFIEGGVRYPNAQNMTTDELYLLAPENPEGGGGGSLGADLDSDTDGMTEQDVADAIEKANSELAKAAMAAKSCGNMPQSLQRMVDKLLEVPTPWYDILARCMTRKADNDYDWTVGDPYFFEENMFLPDLGGEAAGEIVLVKDESGSVSGREQDVFFGHFRRILQTCTPERVHVLHTSTRVGGVTTYAGDALPTKLPSIAYGGTDMGAGLAYAEEHYPNADAIIVLTDGYTPWGSPGRLPVFWLITNRSRHADHGESIYCDLSEAE